MKNTMTNNPKTRLIDRVQSYITENEHDSGVSTQMNMIHARGCLERLEALNLAQAYKTEKAIQEVENYDPEKDRYGWGPRNVSALDVVAFIP